MILSKPTFFKSFIPFVKNYLTNALTLLPRYVLASVTPKCLFLRRSRFHNPEKHGTV